MIYISVYYVIPFFLKIGLRFGEAYLFCFYLPFFILFLSCMILYKCEGNQWNWENFSSRLRLNSFNKNTLLWTIGLFIYAIIAYVITTQTIGIYIAKHIKFLSPPDFLPAGINPTKQMQPGYFFDIPLKGNWWFAIFYFIGWFFNIFGEELMFRGFLLPKDEVNFGNHAWVYQGFIWSLWHFFWKWNVIPLLISVTIPLVFVVQKRKNTWIGIIIHGALNIIPLIMIIYGIIF